MKLNFKDKLDILLNAINIVSVFFAVKWFFAPGHVDVVGSTATNCFNYFTIDSNVLMALTSLMWIVYIAFGGKAKDGGSFAKGTNGLTGAPAPRWLSVLRFASVTAVTLTFLVSAFFLGPMEYIKRGITGYLSMFKENVFFLHFLCPVICIISFVTYRKDEALRKKDCWFALLPMLIYGVLYFYQVLVSKAWKDFYGFTFGGQYAIVPVVIAMIIIITYGIAYFLGKMKFKIFYK